jgi:hypothetical protein
MLLWRRHSCSSQILCYAVVLWDVVSGVGLGRCDWLVCGGVHNPDVIADKQLRVRCRCITCLADNDWVSNSNRRGYGEMANTVA